MSTKFTSAAASWWRRRRARKQPEPHRDPTVPRKENIADKPAPRPFGGGSAG